MTLRLSKPKNSPKIIPITSSICRNVLIARYYYTRVYSYYIVIINDMTQFCIEYKQTRLLSKILTIVAVAAAAFCKSGLFIALPVWDTGIFTVQLVVYCKLCSCLKAERYINAICLPFTLTYADSEHQRARGNLKYFEFQLLKQRSEEEEKAGQSAEGRAEGQTEDKPKKKGFKEPIPERKMYEKLCRGEGIRMVRTRPSLMQMLHVHFFDVIISPLMACFSTLPELFQTLYLVSWVLFLLFLGVRTTGCPPC